VAAHLRRGKSGPDPDSGSRLVIRTQYRNQDDVRNVVRTFLSKDAPTTQIFTEMRSVFTSDVSEIAGKMPYLAKLKNPSKNSRTRIFGSASPPTVNQCPFLSSLHLWYNFSEDTIGIVLREIANRQTDVRQTNKRRVKHPP